MGERRRLPERSAAPSRAALLAGLLLVAALAAGASARGADIGELQAKVDGAEEEAGVLAAELRATQEELGAAEQRAAEAAAREEELSGLLANGRERAAALAADVAEAEERLAEEKRRLRRARGVLAARLVAIYTSGTPDAAGVVLGAGDFDELLTRSEYLERIEDSDEELAARVEQVRDAVRRGLERVRELKERIDAHNARLAAARAEVGTVRAEAEAAAASLASLEAARQASLDTLRARIDEWVADIEAAEAASRAAAEETVERWLGGPYSIPTEIVMCESGGNYGALNPSSGAGGAYQILPSTWELYGGEGAPHEAPKAEQDRIAAEIWADSGSSAWVCAG